MDISQQITIINNAFTDGLKEILGSKLYGAYVYGAAAFNDSLPTGDIDFHVILNEPLTSVEKLQLEALHEDLGQRFPPLGGELDGYYILIEEARKRTPPQSQMWRCATDNAWALHRAHIRAGRYITLYGEDPKEIYLPATWEELEQALHIELQFIHEHLHQYPDYCILNLCRIMYSFETRDVVISKASASEWAFEVLPEWKWLVELGRKSYVGHATSEDREMMLDEVGNLYEYAVSRIQEYT